MNIIIPGHRYGMAELDNLSGKSQEIQFVDRGHNKDTAGTTNQEVLRILINRVQFLNKELPWLGNEEIIKHLRLALVLHEARHITRLVERNKIKPEEIPIGFNGHFKFST